MGDFLWLLDLDGVYLEVALPCDGSLLFGHGGHSDVGQKALSHPKDAVCELQILAQVSFPLLLGSELFVVCGLPLVLVSLHYLLVCLVVVVQLLHQADELLAVGVVYHIWWFIGVGRRRRNLGAVSF